MEMFTGGITWERGTTAPEILKAHLETEPQNAAIPRMPVKLATLLNHCFSTIATARPSMQQIASELHGVESVTPDLRGLALIAGERDAVTKALKKHERFAIHSGVVIDSHTNLMWGQDPIGDIGLCNWREADKQVKAYWRGYRSWGGRGRYKDWRLPTIAELNGLFHAPMKVIEIPWFGHLKDGESVGLWSSNVKGNLPSASGNPDNFYACITLTISGTVKSSKTIQIRDKERWVGAREYRLSDLVKKRTGTGGFLKSLAVRSIV